MAQIGLLKETKTDENRVALRPDQIAILVERGHSVFAEECCGIKSGYLDKEYHAAGANVTDKKSILRTCPLIVKVKEPMSNEYDDYTAEHTLFSYLHLDGNTSRENVIGISSKGLLGIAFEWVEKDGHLPLLEPMSRLTGYLFGMKACELLYHYKGMFPGGHEAIMPGAKVLLMGIGVIGTSALKYFMDINANVTVLDKKPETLNSRMNSRLGTNGIDYVGRNRINLIRFNNNSPYDSRNEISKLMPEIDIVICCAVRRYDLPKSKLDYLITEDMVKKMQPNSVLCDATASIKDFVETAQPHEEIHHFYKKHAIIHYNNDHIPSMVGSAASRVLSNAIFPYVLELAEKGPVKAIKENPAIAKGVNCYKGSITHRLTADRKGIPYKNIMDLL